MSAPESSLAPVPEARVGRPPRVLSDEERQRLTALAGAGLSRALAAARLGLSAGTLREIFKRDPEALQAYLIGRAEIAEEIINALVAKVRSGDTIATIFASKTLGGLREKGPWQGDDGEDVGDRLNISFTVVMPDGSARPLKTINGAASAAESED